MVARLQQVLVLGGLGAATLWAVLWWPHSPLVALAGIGAVTLAHSAFLAIEFIASWCVGAHDPTVRASVRQFARAWWAESRLAARVFGWEQPFRSRAVPDHLPPRDGRRGVLLIHGFLCNRGFWNPWLRELRASHRAVVAVDLAPAFGSIDDYVQTVDAAVAQLVQATGCAPLIVGHSMGGLVARAWLRTADPSRAHRVVSIGSPHAGTWLARFSYSANTRQMRQGGEWLRRLAEQPATTARQVPFTCWYSNCDNIVFPPSTATLPGADNRLAAGLAHVEMAFDARVRRETLALLDR